MAAAAHTMPRIIFGESIAHYGERFRKETGVCPHLDTFKCPRCPYTYCYTCGYNLETAHKGCQACGPWAE